MADLYVVEKDGDGWVIVNRKVGYVVRECESEREAKLLAGSFNHAASQPDEPDPDPANLDPAPPEPDPKAPKGPKTPPPPKADPDPASKPEDPPPAPKKKGSRYWGDLGGDES